MLADDSTAGQSFTRCSGMTATEIVAVFRFPLDLRENFYNRAEPSYVSILTSLPNVMPLASFIALRHAKQSILLSSVSVARLSYPLTATQGF
jgi:hypothetical protein